MLDELYAALTTAFNFGNYLPFAAPGINVQVGLRPMVSHYEDITIAVGSVVPITLGRIVSYL